MIPIRFKKIVQPCGQLQTHEKLPINTLLLLENLGMKNFKKKKMQSNNIFDNLFDIVTSLSINDEIIDFNISPETYSKNYIDILSDLIEPSPLQVPSINIPYNESNDLNERIYSVRQRLKQAIRLQNRKQTLVMFFLLGQLINQNDLSVKKVEEFSITKHQRRVALRVFHLYKYVGMEQILRSTTANVRKILNLKQFEYEQLIESTKFAGAQT